MPTKHLQSVFLLALLSLLGYLIACNSSKPATAATTLELPSKKPNIIFILADDLGYGELGCYGQEKIETPHIDALAKTGIKFTQHYSGSPVCAPSRCVLLTGKHTGHAYIRGNDEWKARGDVWDFAKAVEDPNLEGQRPLPKDSLTIADLLKTQGYRSALIGKWGLGGPLTEGIPANQGFDLFYGYNCQRQAHTFYPKHLWKNTEKVWLNNDLVPPRTKLAEGADPADAKSYAPFNLKEYTPTLMQQEAVQFIKANQNNPFFLYYATPIPHVPLQAPKRWVDYYRQKLGSETPYLGDKGYFPHQHPRAAYAAMISYLDEQVGELIATLKSTGQYDNTLIIFTSDNGPTYAGGADTPFFDSGQPFECEYGRAKGFVQEGGIRVPFIASWPGQIAANSQSDHISAFWDVLPSLCQVSGAAIPPNRDGLSFVPTLLGQSAQQQEHAYLYWEFPSYKGQQAVRMGQWKGIRKNIFEGNMKVELYNLATDLQEQNNVASKYPEIVEQIEAIMVEAHTPAVIERFRIKELGD